jgi:hypothetical protein
MATSDASKVDAIRLRAFFLNLLFLLKEIREEITLESTFDVLAATPVTHGWFNA